MNTVKHNVSTLTPLQIVEGINKLLSSQRKWTKKVYARDKNKSGISPGNPNACMWCLTGALIRVASNGSPIGETWHSWIYEGPGRDARDAIETSILRYKMQTDRVNLGSSAHCFNDEKSVTFADIKAVIKMTIEDLKEKENGQKDGI